MKDMKLGIIGAGEMGYALAVLAGEKGAAVTLCDSNRRLISELKKSRKHPKVLPGVTLPQNVVCTPLLKNVCADTGLILLTTSGAEIRKLISEIGDFVSGDQSIVHTVRRMEDLDGRIMRVSEIIREACCIKKIGVLTTPSTATEMLSEQPSAAVVASRFPEVIRMVKGLLTSPNLQVFENDDLAGVEIACALADVLAIANGLSVGLGFGPGTTAMINTRGLNEMAGIGVELGAKVSSFSGLSGVGQLLALAAGDSHPLYTFGLKLALGKKGVKSKRFEEVAGTIRALVPYARKRKIRIPIMNAVSNVLFKRQGPLLDTLTALVSLPSGLETDFTITQDAHAPALMLAPKGGKGKGW